MNNLGILGNLASFSTSATPADLESIRKEIRDGLQNERVRLDACRKVRDFYEGEFFNYQLDYPRRLGVRDENLNKRSVPFTRSIVDALTRRLYMSSPKRTIVDQPDVSDYLASVYNKGRASQKLRDAVIYSALGGAAAIQVELNQPAINPMTGEPDPAQVNATLKRARPAVNFRVWPADEFCVWCSPDEPSSPYAVAVIDRYNAQTRLRLWTPEVMSVYLSKQWDGTGNTRGTRTFELASEQESFLRLVPWAFRWWRHPTKDFWSWCPGPELVVANEHANARLSKIADDIMFTRPYLFARDVTETFKIPDRYRAGELIRATSINETINDQNGGFAEYLMADMTYINVDREEVEKYLDEQAEMHGVPAEVWRLKGGNAASGVAIVSEQLPIIEACEARQELLEATENDLALVTLMTINAWLGEGMGLAEAIDNFELNIEWPSLTKNRPGEAYDAHLQFELVNEIKNVVQVYMEMTGATEQEALEHFEKKAEYDRFLQSLAPAPVDPMTGQPMAPAGGEMEPATDPIPENEEEGTEPEVEE